MKNYIIMSYEKYNKPRKHFNTATGKWWDEIVGHEMGKKGLTYEQLKLLGRLPGK